MLNLVPAAIRPHVERVLSFVSGLSRPAKVFVASTLVAALLIGGYVSVRSANPPYAILFSNLEREDAAAVVAKLKEMKVPYRLEGEGATIEVPEAQARELRLELAGGGLPRGGSVGFESFDKMRLGATEFEQRILYRRALEGELSRTIGSLSAVQSARVHLVLPEKSVFVSRNEPATASVVVKLRQGRSLGGSEVQSIVHLVASSVAGLTPDRIALVSTDGTVLHKPRRPGEEGAGSDDERASQTRSLEATLEERARSMVEKMVGQGHVDVRVSADLDTSRVERVEDHYDPKSAVVRSEESSIERSAEDVASATGVPGSESNVPGGTGRTGADGGVAAPGALRESHTRNFEVDHIVEKRFVSAGTVRRVTVAVVVDGLQGTTAPRSKEEIEKISALVRSAVGADDKRGDVVTVESVPFIAPEKEVVPPAPAPFAFDLKTQWRYLAGAGGAAFLLLLVLVIALRRRSRRIRVAEAAVVAAAEKTPIAVSEPTKEDLAELEPTTDELRRRVNESVERDPSTAALILRSWLSEAEVAPAGQVEKLAA